MLADGATSASGIVFSDSRGNAFPTDGYPDNPIAQDGTS